MGAMVSRDGGVLGAAVLLALGGVLAVGAAWLARRRCLPSELEAATAGEVKLQGQAGEPAAANAQLELAVAGGVDCCPAAAACTSTSTGGAASTAGGAAADRLHFERGWATKYAARKKTAPERYSQFDLD
jgi:streptolysin S family bacteriocin protoxin